MGVQVAGADLETAFLPRCVRAGALERVTEGSDSSGSDAQQQEQQQGAPPPKSSSSGGSEGDGEGRLALTPLGSVAREVAGANELWLAMVLVDSAVQSLSPPQLAAVLSAVVAPESISRGGAGAWAAYPPSDAVVEAVTALERVRSELASIQVCGGGSNGWAGLRPSLHLLRPRSAPPCCAAAARGGGGAHPSGPAHGWGGGGVGVGLRVGGGAGV